jgi:hypothetical protein
MLFLFRHVRIPSRKTDKPGGVDSVKTASRECPPEIKIRISHIAVLPQKSFAGKIRNAIYV